MTRCTRLAALAVVTAQLAGCFVFIPGSLINKVSDGLTGSEGEHCVSRQAQVGDRISLPGGGSATVKSLSGASIRCTDPAMPIRAALTI